VPQACEPDNRTASEDYASQQQCNFKALNK